MRRFTILAMILLACLLIPFQAFAEKKASKSSKKDATKTPAVKAVQEGELSDQQIMLNNDAAAATKAGEFDKAEKLFTSMLLLGEFDVIWMNLARTYAAENKCLEAKDAYSHVLDAPRLAGMRSIVEERMPAYLQELDEMCNAPIVIECSPADMKIAIDGGVEMSCDAGVVYNLVPGQHMVVGKAKFENAVSTSMNSIVVNAVAGQTTTAQLEIINMDEQNEILKKAIEDAGVSLEDYRHRSKLFKSLGYTFIGVGAGVLGGGLGLALYYYNDYQKKYDANQQGSISSESLNKTKKSYTKYMNGGWAMTAVGGAMLIAGISLVVVDAVKWQPQIERLEETMNDPVSFEFTPAVSYDFAGFMISGTF